MQFAASCTGQRSVSSTTIYPNQIRTFLKLLNCKIFSLSQIFAINPGNIRRISCVEAWCGVCMLYAGAQGVTPAGRGSRGRRQPRLSFNSLQPPASHITTEMRRHTAVLWRNYYGYLQEFGVSWCAKVRSLCSREDNRTNITTDNWRQLER